MSRRDEPDAVCQSCTTDWADDSCSVCGKPICRDCYRTCVECKVLGCPDCMTGIEIADGLVEDACPSHIAKVSESIGCLDKPEPEPLPCVVPCAEVPDGVDFGYYASWPTGRWRWCASVVDAVRYCEAWFAEERRAA